MSEGGSSAGRGRTSTASRRCGDRFLDIREVLAAAPHVPGRPGGAGRRPRRTELTTVATRTSCRRTALAAARVVTRLISRCCSRHAEGARSDAPIRKKHRGDEPPGSNEHWGSVSKFACLRREKFVALFGCWRAYLRSAGWPMTRAEVRMGAAALTRTEDDNNSTRLARERASVQWCADVELSAPAGLQGPTSANL